MTSRRKPGQSFNLDGQTPWITVLMRVGHEYGVDGR